MVTNPRGKIVKGFIHYSDNEGASAAVVLAPGRGYNMDLPLTKGLAEKLAASGVSAVRFDWAYYSEGGKPSQDLKDELEDFSSVIEFLGSKIKIDANKIIVAGKSMGSVVSFKYFNQNPKPVGLMLLTPICANWYDDKGNELEKPTNGGEKNYPKLLLETRDIVFLLGDQDFDSCPIPFLYDFLKDSKGNVKTVVVGGDHGLTIGDRNDEKLKELNQKNMDAAQSIIVQWAHLILNKLSNK